MGDSWRAVWNGSASRLVRIGALVTLRDAPPKSPSMEAKLTRHSFQRIASRSPPMLKYKYSSRGLLFSSPLKNGRKL
ncbi:hypothetical protein D3C81_1625760 [compost metagenome]